jgi:hypothetical protein
VANMARIKQSRYWYALVIAKVIDSLTNDY